MRAADRPAVRRLHCSLQSWGIVVRRNIVPVALLALATTLLAYDLAPSVPALAQARSRHPTEQTQVRYRHATIPAPERGATSDNAIKARMNRWTVGLASGLPDGGFVRYASEMARTMNDGDNMRLIPMVTGGTTSNIADLLYLKGVDAAITYADAFDLYSKQKGLSDISDRVRYIMQFFISDIHIYARDQFKTLADLKGQKVGVGTSGVAVAVTGPLIFRRLGIDIQPVPVGGPIAIEALHEGKIAAMVYLAAKPSPLFAKRKPEPGYHFIPVPYTKQFMDYYYPDTITTKDYPNFLPPGTSIDTIAVPSVLAVYSWKPGSDRADRVNRFVERLFTNFSRLQKPPFHPKWKEVSLEAQVPGWKRYPYAQTMLNRLREANASAAPSAADHPAGRQRFDTFLAGQQKSPMSEAQKQQLYRQFLEWSRKHPPN